LNSKATGEKNIAATFPDLDKQYVEDTLQKKGLTHLKVSRRGASIAVYSDDEDGGKDKRCRFTYVKTGLYILNMANSSGKWEPTPFEGTLREMLDMIIEQFPWTLTDYYQDDI
jgi:hypothetical protein